MEQITLKAPAKINLSLSITGRRQDGYHLLRSVMQAVTLFDTVTVSKQPGRDITITCDKAGIPRDPSNIAYKAAAAFFSQVGLPFSGLQIDIRKVIPSQAGLGGGSADGAAVIVALDKLFDTRLEQDALIRIGLSVGADIPFCLLGGTALAEGIGELLTPVSPLPACHIVISKPPVGVSTAEAYRKFDQAAYPYPDRTDPLLEALSQGDLLKIADGMYNLFEELIPLPEVAAIKALMAQHGALQAVMSGSGSAVYGIFDSRDKAENALAACLQQENEAFLCAPFSAGITLA